MSELEYRETARTFSPRTSGLQEVSSGSQTELFSPTLQSPLLHQQTAGKPLSSPSTSSLGSSVLHSSRVSLKSQVPRSRATAAESTILTISNEAHSAPVPKGRANSIHSVASDSSTTVHAKGKSGWVSNLWGWRQTRVPSIRNTYQSEEEEEDDVSGDDAVVTGFHFNGQSVPQKSRGATSSIDKVSGKSGQLKPKPRTLSKSSSNSTSVATLDSGTAATSFSSQSGQAVVTPGPDDSICSPPLKAASPLSHPMIAQTSVPMSNASKHATDLPDKQSPARALLGRRASSLHAEAAFTTHAIATSDAARDTSRLPSTSTAMLQSISSLQDHSPTDQLPKPGHFRAVSQSASTIGKNSGKLVAHEVFASSITVSDNVSQWTHRLLASLNPPGPALASLSITTDSLTEVAGQAHFSPRNERPLSPRLPQPQKGKAALSPATMDNEGSTTIIKLSAASPTKVGPLSTFGGGASPTSIAPVRQKGYLSSAKGTIGRAFGLGSTSSSSSLSRSRSTIITPTSSQPQSPLHLSSRPQNLGSKIAIEPTLTLPSAFTSFTTPSNHSSPSLPAAHHPPIAVLNNVPFSAPMAVQMNPIVAPAAKPPTLAVDLADQNRDGPLVDRFGFVYDIKAGMKLLKDSRKRQQQAALATTMSLDSPPEPAEVDFGGLREALGLSPGPTPAVETALIGDALDLTTSSLNPTADESFHKVASKTRRDSDGSDAKAPLMSDVPSNQSVRRLLTQLGEMNDNVEKSQKEAWDVFIKRRKSKAVKAIKDEEAISVKKKRIAPIEFTLSHGVDLGDNSDVEQFSENLVGVASMGSGKEDDRTFRKLVRAGVPFVYRATIWAEVSGASEIREPGLYQDLLSAHAGASSPCLEQIDMDTHRTFPTNIFFAGNGPGVSKLRRVLMAYSWRDPMIGYCQGMNLLAAMLLLVYPDEEDAFWMLTSVLEKILPSDYYSPQLLVSQADQRVLQDLIRMTMPDVNLLASRIDESD